MGLLSRCALPANLDEASEWKGTDDDQVWWMHWRLHVKHWFAFAPRCSAGLDLALLFFPLTYLLPLTIWFTGWSWWYLFPIFVIPVNRKWREMPITLFAIKGRGRWRLESSDGKKTGSAYRPKVLVAGFHNFDGTSVPMYLSRVQYWCHWHIALHWPFLLTAHYYWRWFDMLLPPDSAGDKTDGKVWAFYRGFHRDADGIYWGDGAGGPNFK